MTSAKLKIGMLAIIPGISVVLLFLRASASVSAVVLSALLFLWTLLFYRESGYRFADVPILFLLMGTFSFGKVFSLLGVPFGNLTIYVTELMLAASLGLLLLTGKTLWSQWHLPLPKGLPAVLLIYFALGLLYLVIGVKENGFAASRDIVFFLYLLFLFITLRLLENPARIRNLLPFLAPAVILVLLGGIILFFIYIPGSSFRDFFKEIKMTNLGFYYGLILFFGLSFFAGVSKKMKGILGIALWLSFLFIVMAEVRAAWLGLLVALVLLGIWLKKEFKIFVPLFLVVVVSVVTVDYFDLGVQKNKLASLKEQVKSLTRRNIPTMPVANIRWRLDIWEQTLTEIREHPVFGWGYGTQIDYLIWKQRLSWLKAIGANTGIVPPHNHLLAVTYKMGLVGLVLFSFINLRVFFYGFFYIKKCRSDFHRRFLIASLAGFVHWHGMAFFFDILESPPTGIFLWILMGAILGVVYVDQKSTRKK